VGVGHVRIGNGIERRATSAMGAFGHLAYAVDNIYDTCNAFMARGVPINRPPCDGRMAFIRTPDGISIELLQAGRALQPAEPWASMPNTGSW
jgi:lactoylglutathione lyase